MKTIWKYPLPIDDESEIKMKKGAKVLSAGIQFDRFMLWVEVDPTELETKHRFRVQATGQLLPDECKEEVFINTVFHRGLVFHVFDLGEAE